MAYVPEGGKNYYIVWNDGTVGTIKNVGNIGDQRRIELGNCFKDQADAVRAAKAIKTLLERCQKTLYG